MFYHKGEIWNLGENLFTMFTQMKIIVCCKIYSVITGT